MKFVIGFFCLFLFSELSIADSYTCSYPGYIGKDLVIQKIKVSGNTAKIGDDEYVVLQNTKVGLVLVRAFAEYNNYNKKNEVGLFGIAINKLTKKFTRGNILDGGKENSIAQGNCVLD